MQIAMLAIADSDEAMLLSEILAEEDIAAQRVDEAPDSQTPAVIFTDVGAVYDVDRTRQAVERLRERWPDAPVVLLTAHRSAEADAAAITADAVILKPFDIDVMLETTRSVMFSAR
jgi:DNA-binding NarL/FixJ family response regulator